MAKTVKRTRSQRAKSTKSNKSRNKSRSKVRSKVRRRSKSMFMNKQLTKAQKKFRNRYVDERDVSPIRSITTRVNEMDDPLSIF